MYDITLEYLEGLNDVNASINSKIYTQVHIRSIQKSLNKQVLNMYDLAEGFGMYGVLFLILFSNHVLISLFFVISDRTLDQSDDYIIAHTTDKFNDIMDSSVNLFSN